MSENLTPNEETAIAVIAATVLFPPFGGIVPLVIRLIHWWFTRPRQSHPTKADRLQQLALEHEQTERMRILESERTQRERDLREADERRRAAAPTRESITKSFCSVLAGIDSLPIDSDEKQAMKNQQLEEFEQRLREMES